MGKHLFIYFAQEILKTTGLRFKILCYYSKVIRLIVKKKVGSWTFKVGTQKQTEKNKLVENLKK